MIVKRRFLSNNFSLLSCKKIFRCSVGHRHLCTLMNSLSGKNPPLVTVILAFAIVYIVWGSTYFFIQAAERDFPPFILGAIRFFVSGLLLLLWCAYKKYPLFSAGQIRNAFIVGNLLLFIGNGSIIWSETILPSSFVAVLVSAAPVWFVLFDGKNRAQNFKNKFILTGIITGFAGVILLFGDKISGWDAASGWLPLICLLVVVAGSICWAIGSLYSKRVTAGHTLVGIAWQMLLASLSFFVVAAFTKEYGTFHFREVHIRSWLSVIYLITMGSLAGYSAYMWLLQVRPATQVSTNAYVNPVVAVLLGVWFGSETINGVQIGALVIILMSVFIINFDKYKIRRPSIKAETGQ
jgi:drug/metabolite transporter (DMT)-like permease